MTQTYAPTVRDSAGPNGKNLHPEDLPRERLSRCGVQGLVWPQNSSEQRYLSKEERIRGFEVL
ncbi:MAG TPA: hypothetical protein EYQ31_12145, partial [Candidatus Handelsmanbacteria bacterium]|nr:hypothetical protein [Candidatus Handelsmanbacteria bacterium]